MKERLDIPPDLEGNLWHYRNTQQKFKPHRHVELELNLVIQGRATYLLLDRKYEIGRNVAIWLFPGQEHMLLDQSGDFEMWIGVFRPGLLKRSCTTEETRVLTKRNPEGEFAKRLPEDKAGALREFALQLFKLKDHPPEFNSGLGWWLHRTWAEQLLSGPLPATGHHPAVEQAMYLLQKSGEPLDLGQLADRVHLSPARLSHLFKAQTGISTVHFRQRRMLQRFLNLYRSGRQQRTVLTCAMEAGFGSYAQFHRVFRQHMGLGPAEYKKKIAK